MLVISSHKKLLLILSVLILVAGLMVWFTQIQVAEINSELNSPDVEAPAVIETTPTVDSTDEIWEQPDQNQLVEQNDEIEYSFTASEEMTAEELLDQSATVEYQDFGSAGKFVQSIDGVASNENYFWGYYVNGTFAELGVSQTQLQPGDTITFRYEKIEPLQ